MGDCRTCTNERDRSKPISASVRARKLVAYRKHMEKPIAQTRRIWRSMIKRCTDPKHDSFSSYGGRGIAVCDRWLESFDNFVADMGVRPSPAHSIDRIDPDGHYEPGNCRWV